MSARSGECGGVCSDETGGGQGEGSGKDESSNMAGYGREEEREGKSERLAGAC